MDKFRDLLSVVFHALVCHILINLELCGPSRVP